MHSAPAVRGGMDVEEAFSLSDAYIQKCEFLQTADWIMNLQYHMLLDFTERVERLRQGHAPSKLVLDVKNYIRHHLSEPVSAQDISQTLFLSRPYLSRKFKEETGETLTDFILREKTEEAKRLLCYSDKTATAISSYLGLLLPEPLFPDIPKIHRLKSQRVPTEISLNPIAPYMVVGQESQSRASGIPDFQNHHHRLHPRRLDSDFRPARLRAGPKHRQTSAPKRPKPAAQIAFLRLHRSAAEALQGCRALHRDLHRLLPIGL